MNYQHLFTNPSFQRTKNVVFFGNQSSFDFKVGRYLFDLLVEQKKLRRILLPEHGLFSELQDQVGKEDEAYSGVECRSLYDTQKQNVVPDKACFEGADALLVDIPDVGARYFTYTTHLYWLLRCLQEHRIAIPVFVTDRKNPAGTKVEGTPLDARYASFVGLPGLIHRHGLSTGQLATWMQRQLNYTGEIIRIPFPGSAEEIFINPSPNIPHRSTVQVYPGQCFWEATTFSEGRGTTRPFELFGHPELAWSDCIGLASTFNQKFANQVVLRPVRFIPAFHKHQNQVCQGFQLHVSDAQIYHSVFGALYLMRALLPLFGKENFWRKGAYEFDSTCTAAEILIGDDDLIAYVEGARTERQVLAKLAEAEMQWKETIE